MDPEEKYQELLEQAIRYLRSYEYPSDAENRKRIICKKTKKFEMIDGELYYKQKQNRKVLETSTTSGQ